MLSTMHPLPSPSWPAEPCCDAIVDGEQRSQGCFEFGWIILREKPWEGRFGDVLQSFICANFSFVALITELRPKVGDGMKG
jgi:hypothetical protein